MMKLYGYGPTRWIRALWALQESDAAFECVNVNLQAGEHHGAAFRKLNPAGKVPVLVDGDFVLTESVAIVLYLAEKYGGFIPADLKERAEMNRWLMFTATELEQPLWRITRHTRLYPEDKRLPGDVELAGAEFTAMVAVLDDHMRGRDFVMGDGITAADFVLAYTLDWANEFHLLEDFPLLRAYLERMYARAKAPARIAGAVAGRPSQDSKAVLAS
jgi:glutathione S-transferase